MNDYPRVQFLVLTRKDMDADCCGVERKLKPAIRVAMECGGFVARCHKTTAKDENGYPFYMPQQWVWPTLEPIEGYPMEGYDYE